MRKIALVAVGIISFAFTPTRITDASYQVLPFSQNWTTIAQITTDDNWAGVPDVIGYRGDDLTTVTATDSQTILADGAATPVDVIANQANPIRTMAGSMYDSIMKLMKM